MEHRRPLASKRGTGINFAQYNAARGGATAPTRASRRAATAAAAAAAAAVAAAAQPVEEPAPAPAPEPIADAVIPPTLGGASNGISAATATTDDTKPVSPQVLATQEGAPVVAVDWADPVVLAPVAPAATPSQGEDLAAEVRSIFDGNFVGAPGVGSTLGGGDFFGVAPAEAAEAVPPVAETRTVADEKAQESGDDDDELITALASRSRKRRREAKKSDGDSEWVPPGVKGEDAGNEGEKEEGKAGASKRLKAEMKADRVIVKPRGKAMQKAVEKMDVDAVLGKDLDGYSKNAEYHQRLARVKASYEKARKEREDKRAKSGTQQRVYGKKKRSVVQAAMRKEAEERKKQLALDKIAAAGQAEAHQASELAAAAAAAAAAATAAAAAAAAAAASAADDAVAGPVPLPTEAAGQLPSGGGLNTGV